MKKVKMGKGIYNQINPNYSNKDKEKLDNDDIVSEWINDVNVRIQASKRYRNKKNKNKNIENEEKTAQ